MAIAIGRQAVVVGAGMGGLTAARALANHFERVLVLERDVLPQDARDRAGVPQGKHVHLLLAGGQRALSDLFVGFEDDLVRAGAVPIRMGLDLLLERPDLGTFPQRDVGIVAYALSRPLLELLVRHPETRGQRPENFEQLLRFGLAMGKLAVGDPAVHRLTVEVQQLLKPRRVYQDPRLVQRVLAVMAE